MDEILIRHDSEVPANWLLVQELLQRSLLAAGYTHGLPFVEVTNSPHGILGFVIYSKETAFPLDYFL